MESIEFEYKEEKPGDRKDSPYSVVGKKLTRFLETLVGIIFPPWSMIRAIIDRHKLDAPMQLGAGTASVMLPGIVVAVYFGTVSSPFFTSAWEVAFFYGFIVGVSMLGRGIGFLIGHLFPIYDVEPNITYSKTALIKESVLFALLGRTGKLHFYSAFTQHLSHENREEVHKIMMQFDQLELLGTNRDRGHHIKYVVTGNLQQLQSINQELSILINSPSCNSLLKNNPWSIIQYRYYRANSVAHLLTVILEQKPTFFNAYANTLPLVLEQITGKERWNDNSRFQGYLRGWREINLITRLVPSLNRMNLLSFANLNLLGEFISESSFHRLISLKKDKIENIFKACKQLKKANLMDGRSTKLRNFEKLCEFAEFAPNLSNAISSRLGKFTQNDFEEFLNNKKSIEVFVAGFHPRLGSESVISSDAFAKNSVYDKRALELMLSFVDGREFENGETPEDLPSSQLVTTVVQRETTHPVYQSLILEEHKKEEGLVMSGLG